MGKCKEQERKENELSCKDKIVIVTGASAGVGKAAALAFAEREAEVILACRDLKKAEEVVTWIKSQTQSGKLVCMKLDLASLQSVRDFVKEFKSKYEKIDVLVNNAGVSFPPEDNKKSDDGFEIMMGVNHLGHFLLTNLLLDELKKGAPSRIVVVSSETYAMSKFNVDDMFSEKEQSGGRAAANYLYCRSKAANALFVKELAKRVEGTGVNVYCMTPGIVASDLRQNVKGGMKVVMTLASPLTNLLAKTPAQGASTILYCALDKNLAVENGKYYQNNGQWKPDPDTELKDEDARKLWDQSEKLVGL